jgi:anionic cell wall polymer biosynthesis LytR-Cps2A-Psr (LCP) family protein
MNSPLVARLKSWSRTPTGAAALSFLFPGLGQAAAGSRQRGAIVAIPMLAVVAVFASILIFDRGAIFGLALDQGWLTSLLILDLVALVYHLWAIVDAYVLAREALPRKRRGSAAASKWATVLGVGVILTGTVGVHAAVAEVDTGWQHALYCLTAATPCWVADISGTPGPIPTDNSDQGDGVAVTDTSSPGASGSVASSAPLTTFNLGGLPSFTTTTGSWSWDPNGQFNVLLAGIGVQNDPSALGPDTIMVLHVDRATGRAALISIGRNNVCVPLPQGIAEHFATSVNGCPAYTWPQMINAFPNEVLGHCNVVPLYQDTCGQAGDPNRYLRAYKAFEEVIGGLLGLTIDGSMWINPIGLTKVIDDLGGIEINVPTTVYDEPCGPAGTWQYAVVKRLCNPTHNGYSVPTGVSGVAQMIADAKSSGGLQSISWSKGQDVAMVIKAGEQHMDGDWALAYARTREFTSGGDFNRAGRQQLVLKALRTDLDPCKFASPGNVVSLLSDIADIPYAFNSDLPVTNPQDLQAWASLAKNILGGNVKSLVLDPTTAGQPYVTVSGISYPAVDANSWANIKNIVAHSLDTVPAATPSGSGGSSSC